MILPSKNPRFSEWPAKSPVCEERSNAPMEIDFPFGMVKSAAGDNPFIAVAEPSDEI